MCSEGVEGRMKDLQAKREEEMLQQMVIWKLATTRTKEVSKRDFFPTEEVRIKVGPKWSDIFGSCKSPNMQY